MKGSMWPNRKGNPENGNIERFNVTKQERKSGERSHRGAQCDQTGKEIRKTVTLKGSMWPNRKGNPLYGNIEGFNVTKQEGNPENGNIEGFNVTKQKRKNMANGHIEELNVTNKQWKTEKRSHKRFGKQKKGKNQTKPNRTGPCESPSSLMKHLQR